MEPKHIILLISILIVLIGCILSPSVFFPSIDKNQTTGTSNLSQYTNNTNQIQMRINGTNCVEVIPGHNKPDSDRINVVFVPFNMSKESMVAVLPYYIAFDGAGFTTTVTKSRRIKTETGIEIMDDTKTLSFKGLLAIDPFIGNQDKFNFWYVELPQEITIPKTTPVTNYCLHYCVSDIEKTCGVPNIYAVNLCNANCQSYGSWGNNKAYLSHSYSDDGHFDSHSIPLFVHEFGHSFGGLRDEYYSQDGKSSPGYPNCAPDQKTAEEWWGDLVGQGEGGLKIGYFKGCNYSPENIRPSNTSIMKATSSDAEFNLVCKIYLQKKLDLFSGEYSQNIPEHELQWSVSNINDKAIRN